MRTNKHISSSEKPRPSDGSLALQNILEAQYKNFAYEMIELEMSIQNQNGPSIGPNKLEDISKLIQIYMLGVQSLQSCQDQRYQYFSKKLQALMLKKTVVCQLYKGAKSPDIPRRIGEQKRKQHQVHMFYNKQQHEKVKVKQLIANIDKKLEKYSGTVKKQMKTQEQNIQQRLRLRKLRSDNGSISKFDLNGSPTIKQKININSKLADLDDLPTQTRTNLGLKRAQDDNYLSHKNIQIKAFKQM